VHALVTGAAGFIGSHLAMALRLQGHDVLGLDSYTDYYDVDLKRARAEAVAGTGATVLEADLNVVDLGSVLHGVDVVFHLAGQPGVRASWGSDFSIYTRSNIEATQRLLEAARGARQLKRFVYASSSSVYGNADQYPTNENVLTRPISPYGVTKLAAEHLCTLYASNFDVPTVSLRYFTVYGPGQRPDMAFTRFLRAAVNAEAITIYGSGEQVRDFTYVEDVVSANMLAATRGVRPGAVLNVAGGSHTSVNEVLGIIADLTGSDISANRVEAMAGDARRTGGDTATIRSTLGWQPRVSLREGLARQLEWVRANP